MAVSQLTCIYSYLILHNDEVMVTQDKINALIKVAGVNVEPFWPGLFVKGPNDVNIGSLICNIVVGAAPEFSLAVLHPWNVLLPHFCLLPLLASFKSQLKSYFLQQAFSSPS
uniref:Large ribosomal subunit protein P1 n=1 Tax=Monodelphis domestica TaxID=13616 RepID=A0A5F8GS87_MONDO